ncbi:MAG: SDR family oxidoreductase [Marinosulfonomonas sp.]|nr:SDR family oxidoreductase [Marinosulfonomonas sp.]
MVNSAGIILPRSGFEATTDADMERIFSVNVFGTFRMTREALPLMKDGGTILSLSSTLAWRPRPGSALYAATKGAIEAFSMALATEVASQQIRVHIIAPALVRSRIWTEAGMSGEAYAALLAERGREFPLGRVGEPEDVSELIAYLVSDKAAWLTGNAIQVDGGAMFR